MDVAKVPIVVTMPKAWGILSTPTTSIQTRGSMATRVPMKIPKRALITTRVGNVLKLLIAWQVTPGEGAVGIVQVIGGQNENQGIKVYIVQVIGGQNKNQGI